MLQKSFWTTSEELLVCSIVDPSTGTTEPRHAGGVENVPDEGGSKLLFGRGVLREVFLVIAWVQNLCNGFGCSPKLVDPTLFLCIEGICRGLLVQELRTQSRNKKAQRELMELPVDF